MTPPERKQESPTAEGGSKEELSYRQAEAILADMARAFPEEEAGDDFALPPALLPAGKEGDRRKAASEATGRLRKAELRYRTLIEQIPAVTFLAALNEGSHELYVSPQIETLLGFSQEEWLGNPILWYTQLHPDDRERWQTEFARTCARGVNFCSEYRFLARDGRVVWVHGECQVVRDERGQPLFLQGIAYNITERKEAEEALRRMHHELEILVQNRTAELAHANEALREENRRKDHFLATLGHELRNPLAPIRTSVELLRQPGVKPEMCEWAIGIIDRQIRHMTRLVDDLLDMSRINQGKIQLHKETVDLAAVVMRAVEVTRPLLTERRHELSIALPQEPLRLEADTVRLEQVAINLLTNAAKYTEPGGRIWVTAQREESEAVLRVRDSGVGIPPEMLERIFDMFVQVDRDPGRTVQWGLGVGLALVRRLVELHGGSIKAFSPAAEQGSEFVVRLPLSCNAFANESLNDRSR